MPGNPHGLRSLAKYSTLPIERICYLPDADESVIQGIKRGVLFLMAFWSGTSVRGFGALTKVISELDARSELEIVVADIDGLPPSFDVPEFRGKIGGNGETAWVRNGAILATSDVGLNTECFAPYTLLLLTIDR